MGSVRPEGGDPPIWEGRVSLSTGQGGVRGDPGFGKGVLTPHPNKGHFSGAWRQRPTAVSEECGGRRWGEAVGGSVGPVLGGLVVGGRRVWCRGCFSPKRERPVHAGGREGGSGGRCCRDRGRLGAQVGLRRAGRGLLHSQVPWEGGEGTQPRSGWGRSNVPRGRGTTLFCRPARPARPLEGSLLCVTVGGPVAAPWEGRRLEGRLSSETGASQHEAPLSPGEGCWAPRAGRAPRRQVGDGG